jgi:hypothetical protein
MTDPVPYHRRSPLEHDLPPRLTWHVHPQGLHVYVGAELVAVIPARSFGNLIYELAKAMR